MADISVYCGTTFREIFFMRAIQLTECVGKQEESQWYRDKLQESISNWELEEGDK